MPAKGLCFEPCGGSCGVFEVGSRWLGVVC
jgi:hypothetical protein